MSRIRMGLRYGETPPNLFSDLNWIRQNETELLAKYGESSILVYQQRVIGVGATYQDAIAAAENNLPDTEGEITPVHQWLRARKTRIGVIRKVRENL